MKNKTTPCLSKCASLRCVWIDKQVWLQGLLFQVAERLCCSARWVGTGSHRNQWMCWAQNTVLWVTVSLDFLVAMLWLKRIRRKMMYMARNILRQRSPTHIHQDSRTKWQDPVYVLKRFKNAMCYSSLFFKLEETWGPCWPLCCTEVNPKYTMYIDWSRFHC